MAGAAILQFPDAFGNSQKRGQPVCSVPEMPTLDRFDHVATAELFKISKAVKDSASELIEFVDTNRQMARMAGIETIAIEVSTLLEGDRLAGVLDALRDAGSKGREAELTQEGLSRLRRAEKLIAEANSNIKTYLGNPSQKSQIPEMSGAYNHFVAQSRFSSSNDSSVWMPFVLIGAISIVGIVATIAFMSMKQR